MDEARGSTSMIALVFAGGDPPEAGVSPHLDPAALVIAADSGVEHAQALDRHVDIAVGDFDSVAPEALARAVADGASVQRYPPDKDATDLELALDVAATRGATHVTIVGGHGGRLDHTLANLLLLGAARFAALELDAWFGTGHVTVVRRLARLAGAPGAYVSLLAVDGPADGVSTSGLRYPLHDARLLPGSTLGVSNELVAPVAEISVGSGVVVAVQPDALDGEPGRGAG
jgi:thiamine pyrophosphokinase